jgi:hypothetical protein
VTDGEVVAVDQHGRPVLVRRRHGSGQAILGTLPFEYFAARSARINPEHTWRLYDALADEAGVERTVRVDDPRVITDGLSHRDGREFAWLINVSGDVVNVGQYGVEQLSPYEVAVVQLPATRLGAPTDGESADRHTHLPELEGERL